MSKIKKSIKLSPEEKHWIKAEEQSKQIIDRLLNRNLPLEFRPQDLDLEKIVQWRIIARDGYDGVPAFYSENEELPNVGYLAEQIAYHYLLTIVKRFLNDLSEYPCHDSCYFRGLTEND